MSDTDTTPAPDERWKRTLVYFLSSQTLSLFGSSLVQYAILWHITLTARSGVIQTFAILAGFVPQFLLSPFAGVWADRHDRRHLVAIADGGIAVATLGLAFALQSGIRDLWLFLLVLALRSLGAAVQTPAVGALVPQFVPQDQLTRVNGIHQSLQSATMLASPALAALLLAVMPLQTIFYIDVLTAVLAIAVLLFLVDVPAHERAQSSTGTSYLHDLKEGIGYVRGHDFVMRFFAYCAIFMVLVAPAAFLTPLQVARSFGPEVWKLGAIEVAFSVGMTAGGLFIASWGGFGNRVRTMALATALFAVTIAAMGLVPWFSAYLAFMGLCGVAVPLFNTPSMVLLQEQVEPDYLGRVMGVMGMVGSAAMPLGMVFFGPLADLVRIEWLLVATGLVMGAQAVAMFLDRALVAHGQALPSARTEGSD